MDLPHLSLFVQRLAQAVPGKGIGFLAGVAGTLLCLLSVVLYTPRRRMAFLQGAGSKRFWLNLHIVLGIGGPLIVATHAHLHVLGLKGLVNLAMWATVASGVVARFVATRSMAARLKRETLLQRLGQSFGWEGDEDLYFLPPQKKRRVLRAMNETAGELPSGLAHLTLLFFRDLRVIWILWRAAQRLRRGKRLDHDRRKTERRDRPISCETDEKRRRRGRRAPPEAFRLRLVLQRNILLFSIYEASAPFWISVHIGFSLIFFLALSLHVAVAALFKPELAGWL